MPGTWIVRVAIVAAAVVMSAGCYRSWGRPVEVDAAAGDTAEIDTGIADSTDMPDAITDTPIDIPMDTAEEDAVPDPACLYAPMGSIDLREYGHSTVAPKVLWNGTDVGVVMFHSGGSLYIHSYISLSNVAADLTSRTGPITIGEESHGWGEVAWTGEAMGLCWHMDPGMVGRTAFRLHSRDGAAIGPTVDLDFEGEACLGLVYGGGRFLAAWRHETVSGGDMVVDTRVQVLDGTGTPVGTPFDVASGPYPGTTPALAWTGEEFVVAVPSDDMIEFRWISTTGVITRTDSIEAPGAVFCKVAWEAGAMGVAWLSGPEGARSLMFRVLGADLSPAGRVMTIEEEGAGAMGPFVAAVPDGWALTWHRGEYPAQQVAMMLHLDPAGVPREPRTVMYLGHNSGYGSPTSVGAGDDLYVGISFYPEGEGLDQVSLLGWTCEPGAMDVCDPQDADVIVPCDYPVSLGWKWDGAACGELIGCEGDCNGVDCVRLAISEAYCLSDRHHCP